MRSRVLAKGTAFLPLVLVLGGCVAPTAHMTPIQPLEPAASIPFLAIFINVESSTPEDIYEEVADVAFRLTERIRDLNAVPQVIQAERSEVGKDELLIRLTISDMRKVGGVKRFFLGIFAGKASMTSTAEFIDGNTQERIGSYEIIGDTPGNQGTTGTAILLTVEAIVDILKETYSITGG